MKKNIILSTLVAALFSFGSCTDWLLEEQPGVTKLDDFYTSADAAIQNVTACYVPLQWEYNRTYFPEWFIGDVVSDDALKGGQDANDMGVVFDMENWKVEANNTYLLDYYQAQYQGIGRCNLALTYIPQMEQDTALTASLQGRLIGEAKFLRAYYYFRLLRVFGSVPYVDFIVESESDWAQPATPVADLYGHIIKDLEDAQKVLWKKSEYADKDLGRVTKGAAEAMLLKVNLYNKNYAVAKAWGDSIIQSGEYDLCPVYADNFTLAGENGIESVFEIQYVEDPTSDYGQGNGFTRGTFTAILTRSRSSQLGGGWGFNRPSKNLYSEFESGDPRRDVTILNPPAHMIENPATEIYYGTPYLSRKYGMYNDDFSYVRLAHPTRGPLNNKQIRYADVYLMYAEACLGANDAPTATIYLNKVRERVDLPIYPGYTFTVNGSTISNPTLEQAIRHERRMELAMEGHRWFDLCRWGIAKETMDAYKQTIDNEELKGHMAEFIRGKHELFPIPSEELLLNPEQRQ